MSDVTSIQRTFGNEYLKYVLAIQNDWPDPDSFSPEQEHVLSELEAIVTQAAAATSWRQAYEAISLIVAYSEEADTTRSNAWRLRCGGSLIDLETSDELEECLLRLARDLYPRFLVPNLAGSLVGINRVFEVWPIQQHPAMTEFAQAVMSLALLPQFFPGLAADPTYTGDGTEVRSQLIWSNGRGNTCYLAQLPGEVLASAYDLASSPGSPTAEEYLESVRRTFATVRKLGFDGQAPAPVLVGLSNLTLPDGVTIPFNGGELRPPTNGDRSLLLQPQGLSAVLQLDIDLRLLSAVVWPTGSEPAEGLSFEDTLSPLENFQNDIRRTLNLFRLALLLASPTGTTIAPTEIAVAAINPLESSRTVTPSVYRLPVSPMPATAISADIAAEVLNWWPRVQSQPSGLDITVRRLLSITVRLDPLDGFVDAVICWENMFGSGEGEVIFRIANSIARLLAPDDGEAAAAILSEVKHLYAARSRYLHGAKEPSKAESARYRDRATDISLQCLRRLYSIPDLLNAASSAARSQILMLKVF